MRTSSLRAILGAGGMSRLKRRQKALKQPRDYMGRWVGAGAHVKWKSSANGRASSRLMSGQVTAIKDGKAVVQVKNPDGSFSNETHYLDPSTLGVVHSKARLPMDKTVPEHEDPDNDPTAWAKKNADTIRKTPGGVRVKMANGYQMEAGPGEPRDGDGDGLVGEAEKRDDEDDPESRNKIKVSSGNPIIYQLYAQSGRSLGIYDEQATDDLTDIVETDSDLIENGDAIELPGYSEGSEVPAPAPAPGPMVSSGAYSVPVAVRQEIDEALVLSVFSRDERPTAEKFCSGDQVTLEEISWLRDRLDALEVSARQADRWSKKIISKKPIRHSFDSERYAYFVTANEPGTEFSGMVAVDIATGDIYEWSADTFFGPVGNIESYEVGYAEQIDSESANEAAYRLLEEPVFTPSELYPHEANMFSQASSMLDYDMLDTFSTYTAQERSADATSQARVGGKFTPVNFTAPTVEGDTIEESAPEVANSAGDGTHYFAIVDDVDETLVMDIVAITSASGKAVVFARSGGQWTPDTDLQTKLESAVPPPVVSLKDEDTIKQVLKQIDEYDSAKKGKKVEDAIAASGYSLPDGRARIMNREDLERRIEQFAGKDDLDVIQHIVRRATALNARDIVPQDMIAFSTLRQDPSLIGPYGEVLVAASGAPESSPLESLQKYWLFGPHSADIRWGTPGDVDRAVPYLNKYVGPDRAESFAISLRGLSL